jgi:UDP-N-acetylglucosamine 2-epimerase (non-hydrolysing)
MLSTNKGRILVVAGTRPEGIKLAPLILRMKETAGLEVQVCVSAQHRQMLDPVLEFFGIRPDYDLDVMRPDQKLEEVTSAVLRGVAGVLERARPRWTVVQGDTITTFASALASFYARVPVAHVEAGLRTGDPARPWPEEMNRRMTDTLSDLLFAPTEEARDRLFREGVSSDRVFVTGNTVVDALRWTERRLQEDLRLQETLERQFSFLDRARRLVLVTGHRRESFQGGLEEVCRALLVLVRGRSDLEVVYPVHLNPNVQRAVRSVLGAAVANVHLIDPVEYPAFVYLMRRSCLIISDSGGIQEEAPSLGKPVLVTREVTERPEGVRAGSVRLVGTDPERIVAEAGRLLSDEQAYRRMSVVSDLYGDGRASERIVEVLSGVT